MKIRKKLASIGFLAITLFAPQQSQAVNYKQLALIGAGAIGAGLIIGNIYQYYANKSTTESLETLKNENETLKLKLKESKKEIIESKEESSESNNKIKFFVTGIDPVQYRPGMVNRQCTNDGIADCVKKTHKLDTDIGSIVGPFCVLYGTYECCKNKKNYCCGTKEKEFYILKDILVYYLRRSDREKSLSLHDYELDFSNSNFCKSTEDFNKILNTEAVSTNANPLVEFVYDLMNKKKRIALFPLN